jgi:hypothetical protein
MANNKRNIKGNKIQDPSIIDAMVYNNAAGSRKSSEVGRHLLPLGDGLGAFTTDASSRRVLPSKGVCLAVYNNSAALGSITLGEDNTVVSLAAGATDASGHVGIPCTPNRWTYIACAEQNWVISSAATLLVFLIDDDTFISQETTK